MADVFLAISINGYQILGGDTTISSPGLKITTTSSAYSNILRQSCNYPNNG
jgi:hypothetical protein